MAVGRVLTSTILPLALRHVRHRGRVASAAMLALACGVAAVVATQVLHASVVASYATTARSFAGRAALEVTNGASGVPEELVDELRGVAGVQAVAGSVEGFVAAPDIPGERLYLYGVDLLGDQEVRDYGADATAVVSDPMVFLAAPDSVALTEAFARAHRLAMQDHLRVLAPAGAVDLTLRAVLGVKKGPASALDGRLAVVDLSVAQELLRFERRVSQIAIAVGPEADLEDVQARVAAIVGSRGIVEPPRARAASFARLLTNYRNGLVLAAAVAMLVALHFIANIAALAVEDRRRELALLRTVGAPRGVVAGLVIGEMAVVALVAAALGLPLGIGAARAVLARSTTTVALLYGDPGSAALQVGLRAIAVGLGVSFVVALAAVIGPVRRVLRIRPVEILCDHVLPAVSPRRHVHAYGGAVLALVAVMLWAARARLPFGFETVGMAAILGVLLGLALALPALIGVLAIAIDGIVRRFDMPAVLIAARFAAAERRRIAVTCAAVTVGLAGSLAVATWISSLDATLHAAFDAVFGNVDVVVSGGADPFDPDAVRMPADVAADIAAGRDVAFADAVRVDTIAFAGGMATVVARDGAGYVEGRRRLYMVEGDPAEAARRLAAGSAVVVNRAFARRFGRRVGDVIELATPEGRLRLPIAGIHLELTPGDLGVVQLDRALYRQWWRDDSASVIEVGLRGREARARVVDGIRVRWGARHDVVVLTVEELRRTYRDLLDRLAGLVEPVLAVALGCALVGVLAAASTATLVRRRTFALLRVVGCTRAELARIAAIELGTIGGLAAVVALLLGAVLGRLQVEVLLRGMLGLAVEYASPVDRAAGATAALLVVTVVAGWVLGRRAGRVPIRDGLACE